MRVNLLGLDIGTTTCRAMVYSVERAGTDLLEPRVLYTSAVELTPFEKDDIDLPRLVVILNRWKKETEEFPIAAGGVIITGLAARSKNVGELQTLLPEMLLVTAEDPRYESWLCFKGSVYRASLKYPEKTFLHLDIGGGTTNLSVGKNGEVLDTGSYFIGARHVRYEKEKLGHASSFAREISQKHGIKLEDRPALARFFCEQLEQLVTRGTCWAPLVQAPLKSPLPRIETLSFSGGFSSWIYDPKTVPAQTFGDLGSELARAIRESKILRDIPWTSPEEMGFATVAGLALYGSSFSGQSIFLPTPTELPLRGVPIVHSFAVTDLKSARAMALFLSLPTSRTEDIEKGVERIRALVKENPWVIERPLVLLLNQNVGKTFGNLLTDWKKLPYPLYVIDQVPPPTGQFVHIGREDRGIVPVSYYGMV